MRVKRIIPLIKGEYIRYIEEFLEHLIFYIIFYVYFLTMSLYIALSPVRACINCYDFDFYFWSSGALGENVGTLKTDNYIYLIDGKIYDLKEK